MGYGNRSLKDWAEHVYSIARDAGWHDEPMAKRERIAVYFLNIVSEATEAWESFRAGKLHEPCDKADKMRALGLAPLTCLEEELADIVIRAFDTAEALGIDIEHAIRVKSAYNETRPAKARREAGVMASDKDLLSAVLARSDRLDARTLEAFEQMRKTLPRWGALTHRQRQWLQAEAHRIGLDIEPCDRPQREAPSAWDPSPKRRKGFPR